MHQPGLHQLADGLTKQLASERVWKLMEAWSFFKGNSSEMKKVTINVAPSDEAAAASTTQATVATTCQESTVATTHVHEGTLGRCIRALIGLGSVAGVLGAESGGSQVYTGVDSDYELWIAVILVMITTVLCWEWSKKTAGGVKKAIKLKMLSSSTGKQKLSKSEGKELLSLLNKGDRSAEQDARLATLIGIFQTQGVLHSDGDSTSVGREGSSSKPTSTTSSAKERFQPEKWSRGVQTDSEPHVPPQAVQKSAVDVGIRYIVQPWEDDLYVSPNGDRIHLKTELSWPTQCCENGSETNVPVLSTRLAQSSSQWRKFIGRASWAGVSDVSPDGGIKEGCLNLKPSPCIVSLGVERLHEAGPCVKDCGRSGLTILGGSQKRPQASGSQQVTAFRLEDLQSLDVHRSFRTHLLLCV